MRARRISRLIDVLRYIQADYYRLIDDIRIGIKPGRLCDELEEVILFEGVFAKQIKRERDRGVHTVEDTLIVELYMYESLVWTLEGVKKELSGYYKTELNIN